MATKYENYITGDDASQGFYDTLAWESQTFTPSSSHSSYSVKLKLSKGAGTIGTITASIFATDNDDKPTGSALCSGMLASSVVTTDAGGDWYEIVFTTSTPLLIGIIYAIVVKNSTDDPTKAMVWRRDGSSPTYTGGMRHTTANEGASWTAYSVDDFMFEEWGDGTGLPIVTTQAVTSIVSTTATGNGNVTDLGDSSVTEHGHCWNTGGLPTTSDSKTTNGSKATTGTFTSSLTSLTSGTLYYVRAYATNTDGTTYGDEVSFTAGSPRGGELSGLYAVVEERFHYVDAFGVERYILGEPV